MKITKKVILEAVKETLLEFRRRGDVDQSFAILDNAIYDEDAQVALNVLRDWIEELEDTARAHEKHRDNPQLGTVGERS